MLGCKPLTNSEVESIAAQLSLRDRAIFILGIRTGFRVSELLSLNVGDVLTESGTILECVHVQKRNTKGKTRGRVVPIHEEAKQVLRAYLESFPAALEAPLFRSNRGGRTDRFTFDAALKSAALKALGSNERVATHTMRKTFAARMNAAVDGNIYKLQKLMGHASISSTAKYIEVNEEEIMNLFKK